MPARRALEAEVEPGDAVAVHPTWLWPLAGWDLGASAPRSCRSSPTTSTRSSWWPGPAVRRSGLGAAARHLRHGRGRAGALRGRRGPGPWATTPHLLPHPGGPDLTGWRRRLGRRPGVRVTPPQVCSQPCPRSVPRHDLRPDLFPPTRYQGDHKGIDGFRARPSRRRAGARSGARHHPLGFSSPVRQPRRRSGAGPARALGTDHELRRRQPGGRLVSPIATSRHDRARRSRRCAGGIRHDVRACPRQGSAAHDQGPTGASLGALLLS